MADRTITLRLEIDGREVEAKLRATDVLVAQLQRHLADVGTTGQQAGRTAAAGLDAIEREIRSGTIVSIRQANDALRQLDALFEEATDDATRARIAALSQEVHALRGRMMGAATAIGTGFNPAAMQMVRIVQDAPYGFLAVANNLQELITQLALSAKAGGGFRAALQGLIGSLIGPAGIVAALSALIAFGPQLWDWFSRLIGLSDDSAEALKKLRDEIAKLAETKLQDVFGDLSVEELERLRAAQERLLETRRRSLELLEAEIARLKERRDELQLRQSMVALTKEEARELERIQQRLTDLEQMRRSAGEELVRQEAVLETITERIEEARREQQIRVELTERAAQAGVKTREEEEKEAEAARKAAEAAEREAAARKRLAELRREEAARREERLGRDLPEPDLDFTGLEPLLTRDEMLARATAEAHRVWQEAMRRSSEGAEVLRRSLLDAIQAEIAYRESLLATGELSETEVKEQQERITQLRELLARVELEGAGAFEEAARVIGEGARVTLGEIEQLIAALERYKKTLADPAQIQAVDAVIGRLNAMREAMQQGGQQVIDLSAKLSGELANALTDLAVDLAEVIASFGQTANVASGVIAAVLRTMARFATQFGRTMIAAGTASLALRSLLVNPFAAISAGVALVAIGSTLQQLVDALTQQDRRQRYARGGLVEKKERRYEKGGLIVGPGGPEDDRIPALVSAGEYIVRARAAERALPLLEEINRRGEQIRPAHVQAAMAVLQAREMPRFAAGGLVGAGVRLGAPAVRIAGRMVSQELVVRVQGELVGRGRDLLGVIRETERIVSRTGT